MLGFARTRRLGSWGAWAAAYALILNTILTSALAAAIPPDQYTTAFELCLSSRLLTGKIAASTVKETADNAIKGSQKGAPIHCPMCASHFTAIEVPASPALAERVAVANPLSFPAHEPLLTLARIIFHHARGPPQLI